MKNLNIDLNLDLDLDLGLGLSSKNKTSDSFKKEAKRFLDKLQVTTANIKEKTYQIIYNVQNELRLPKKGEQLRIRMQQSINLFAVLLKIVEHHGSIDQLTITTYTLNKETISVLSDLVSSGRIKKMSLWVASSYTFRDPKQYENIKSTVLKLRSKNKNIHLCFAWIHLKLTLAKCGDNYYQIEGSMNYSSNNMAEQILFEESKEMYKSDEAFLNEAILKNNANHSIDVIC